jgi:hypothetical protein
MSPIVGYDPTGSPKASQSGFSQTKPESITFEVSAGRAVTPQYGQMGARPASASSHSAMIYIIAEAGGRAKTTLGAGRIQGTYVRSTCP